MRKDTRLPDGLKQLREMSLDIARSSCRNREQREYYRVINQIESELNSRGECGFVYYKVTYQRNIGAEGECRSKFDVVFSDRPFENRLGYCELKRKPPSAPLDTAYYRTCGEIYGVAYKSNCCGN